jgi:hypothetical protein
MPKRELAGGQAEDSLSNYYKGLKWSALFRVARGQSRPSPPIGRYCSMPPCSSRRLPLGVGVLSFKFVTKHKLAREQDVLMMTAIGVEGHWHQAAAVLPEVEDRAVGSADRNSVRPHAHHL